VSRARRQKRAFQAGEVCARPAAPASGKSLTTAAVSPDFLILILKRILRSSKLANTVIKRLPTDGK